MIRKSELLNEQKKIIGQLSGHTALEKGNFINSRSTKEERQLTREYLSELIKSIGLTPEYQEYNMPNVNPIVDLLFKPFKGANVYTILTSTKQSDEYIVIGAHFDTERNCPGAIDNASGIAISFGVIKKLMELEERNINVILVYFDQEEEDLIGSQAFAKKLKKEKLKILSVHTLDTMGWDRDGDKAVELELPTEFLKNTYTKIGKKLGIPIYSTKVNSTDHHSFRELDFNATGLTDELLNGDYAPYKDTKKDTYETVNFDYVTSCTKLVYEVVKELIK
jgi:Zn-dependent M28 family amino/carboxypeptidase